MVIFIAASLARSIPAFLASDAIWSAYVGVADKHGRAAIDDRSQSLRGGLRAAANRQRAESLRAPSQPAQKPMKGPNEKAK